MCICVFCIFECVFITLIGVLYIIEYRKKKIYLHFIYIFIHYFVKRIFYLHYIYIKMYIYLFILIIDNYLYIVIGNAN